MIRKSLILLLTFVTLAFSQTINRYGSTAANFLEIGAGSATTAMGDAGVTGILGAPPFPAMAIAYKNNELDSIEIAQLTAFLKHADSVSNNQEVKRGADIFVIGGGGGLTLLFLLIALYWKKRLKISVKHDIYKRQIKSI